MMSMLATMATLTIRKIDERTKRRLRVRAAQNNRSMEEEARTILREALDGERAPAESLATSIMRLFQPFGGVELDIPPRAVEREPPDFS